MMFEGDFVRRLLFPFLTTVLFVTPTASRSAPSAADVDAIKKIYAERASDFVSLRGRPQDTDKDIWYGTITVAGVPCYMQIDSDGGSVYGCSTTRSDRTLDEATAKQLYAEIKDAVDAAVPGLTWFAADSPGGALVTEAVAGNTKDALTVDVQLLDLGDIGSSVSLEIAARPYSRALK
jgi:hypothetical protein